MATFTPYVVLRKEVGGEFYNVNQTLNQNWDKLDAIFDPAGVPGVGTPKALLRGQALTPTVVDPGALLDLQPTWNNPASEFQVINIGVTHTGAAGTSRPFQVKRGANTIFDVDITTAAAANGVSVRGAATASPPSLRAVGPDTNIGLDLVPKGTGAARVGTDTIATLTATQTLSGKTIDAPTLTGAAVLNGTFSGTGIGTGSNQLAAGNHSHAGPSLPPGMDESLVFSLTRSF